MLAKYLVAAAALVAPVVQAHMELSWPPPLRSKHNQFTTDIDYSMTTPLSSSGSDYPCKGYQALLSTDQGKSVTTLNPGQTYQFTIAGTATHGGGSCQALMSYDGGNTFKVMNSIMGGCPTAGSYDFTVPGDAPSGPAVFAWTWFNNLGNREMYMNCASVTVGASGQSRRGVSTPWQSRPANFIANVGNGCTTVDSRDVIFPDPGADTVDSTNPSGSAAPVGSCGASGPSGGSSGGSGSGSGSGSDSGAGSGSEAASSSAAPAESSAAAPSEAAPSDASAPSNGTASTDSAASEATPSASPNIKPSNGKKKCKRSKRNVHNKHGKRHAAHGRSHPGRAGQFANHF